MTDAAALVVAKAPVPGLCKTRLEPLLGPDGCAALQAGLIRRAAAWAAEAGDAFVAFTPGSERASVAALCPGATLIEQAEGSLGERLVAAVDAVFAQHGGPVLVVGVDTPQLAASHAWAALDDLADGIDVTFGPAADGGYYLVGMRSPHPELFALPRGTWGGPEVFSLTLAAIAEQKLSLGMLRSERDIDDESDVRAFLADPLCPPDIAALMRV